jgi:integrase
MGFSQAADFLETKGRKSPKTALGFWHGINAFNKFLGHKCNLNLQTVINKIGNGSKAKNKLDAYKLLNEFIGYLKDLEVTAVGVEGTKKLMNKTINNYVIGARRYFVFCGVNISSDTFKDRVGMMQTTRGSIEAIDANDIREILNHCDNKRLKAYLLVLASGGMRAVEALSIREQDVNWNKINFADKTDKLKAAGIHLREQYTKTRHARDIYISNEAARYLNEWLVWKYRIKGNDREAGKKDLIFARINQHGHPSGLYNKMAEQFKRALEKAGYHSLKEDGVYKRRNISFHSFRRFAKTTIANRARNSDYSEWFIGHALNTYYRSKESELREIYEKDCMQFMTFLDTKSLEQIGKDIESNLQAKMDQMRQEYQEKLDAKDRKIEELMNQSQEQKTLKDEVDDIKRQLAELARAKQTA